MDSDGDWAEHVRGVDDYVNIRENDKSVKRPAGKPETHDIISRTYIITVNRKDYADVLLTIMAPTAWIERVGGM